MFDHCIRHSSYNKDCEHCRRAKQTSSVYQPEKDESISDATGTTLPLDTVIVFESVGALSTKDI